ncbi:hypothetical protein Taro_055052 [Colocasia esculenta]|uniref:Uncharacterized protein n=1 Tax=Colocasia esculenta TaxID=4460 RepID=A0A843XT13_COLES|nr:hypothetical protein [Colocasia esculenta]
MLLWLDPGCGSWRCSSCFRIRRLARAKQMLVCRVAPLVERYDTCLWLLSTLCWLVVNSSEVLPEFLSVGSGGGVRCRTVVVAIRCAMRC